MIQLLQEMLTQHLMIKLFTRNVKPIFFFVNSTFSIFTSASSLEQRSWAPLPRTSLDGLRVNEDEGPESKAPRCLRRYLKYGRSQMMTY